MQHSFWFAKAALTATLSFAVPAASSAKPADLPVDVLVSFDHQDAPEQAPAPAVERGGAHSCEEQSLCNTVSTNQQQEANGQSQRRQATEAPVTPGVVRFTPVNREVHRSVNRVMDGRCPAADDNVCAAALFQRAEQARLSGSLNQARTAYQEVHLISPASRLGRLAIQRLRDIEATSAESFEEQEPPLMESTMVPESRSSHPQQHREMQQRDSHRQPTENYREMLRTTEPLGAAPVGRDPF